MTDDGSKTESVWSVRPITAWVVKIGKVKHLRFNVTTWYVLSSRQPSAAILELIGDPRPLETKYCVWVKKMGEQEPLEEGGLPSD